MSERQQIEDGGPAFPTHVGSVRYGATDGLSLRDYFAGQALAGILASETNGDGMLRLIPGVSGQLSAAIGAYEFADSMLAARNERPQP